MVDSELLPVVQADREAAADYSANGGWGDGRQHWLENAQDSHPLIQAFARQRLQARADALSDVARLCALYDQWCKNWGMDHNQRVASEAAEEIAAVRTDLPELRLIADDEEAAKAVYSRQEWWIKANAEARAKLEKKHD